jgi:phosphatidylglycerophosphatase A
LPSPGLPPWHPAVVLASGLGAGLLPVAPGSWGSLAALPLAWAIHALWGAPGLAAGAALVFLAGWWASAAVVRAGAAKDPAWIVIDEVAGQWLALLPAPLDPVAYGLAFLLFRLFDIWKPWPVRLADRRVGGGLGVMLDDALAAAYAALTLAAALALA